MTAPAPRTPRHPSNRSFIEQMKQWGWETGKTDGQWQSMFSPPVTENRVRIRVRPATQHQANPTTVFLDVYKITCDGDSEMFWRGPSAVWLEMLANEVRKAEQRKRDQAAAELAKAAQRAEAQRAEAERRNPPVRHLVSAPQIEPTQEVTVAHEPTQQTDVRHVANAKLASKDVLDVLTAHDRPMSVKAIGAQLGLDTTDHQTKRDIANRAAYLVSRGLAERVMNGSYRIAKRGQAVDHRVRHDIEAEAREAPAVARQSVVTAIESIDDSMEAVLDLLLPEGFKASHLRFITPWMEATRRMVEAVRNG